jgi:chloramphenicol-sensitive protein RarD
MTAPTAEQRVLPDKPATAPFPGSRSARAGLAFGLGASLAWGFVPAYFKLLKHVPPLQVLSHRVVWSVLFLGFLLAGQRRGREVLACARQGRTLLLLSASTVMIAANWYVFIWAVEAGRVMEASLGYFINPLVNVLLGMLFLKERLRRGQAAGLCLAAVGVVVLAVWVGAPPWASLALALSFGFYGLLRKVAHIGPLVGLSVETALLLPLALAALALGWGSHGHDVLGHATATAWGARTCVLLVLAGVVTAVPLLWFAAAAQRLRLATLGFLQYLAPTCQFLLAVFAYGEPFTRVHAVSFGLIWAALAVYSLDSLRAYRRDLGKASEAGRGTDDPSSPKTIRHQLEDGSASCE